MNRGKFEKKPGTPRKKGLKGWQKILIAILAVLLLLVGGVMLLVNHVLGKISRFDEIEHGETIATDEFMTDTTFPSDVSLSTMDPSDVTLETVDPLNGENIVNILLIGQDDRPGESRARSDSMIVVSLNREKNAIQLTSFLRDTYVQIPGWADNRLNVPYRYEGVDLLNETMLVNFGLEIDGNVAVDFDMFQNVIDLLGGVDVDIDEEEASVLNYEQGFDLKPGPNHLDGWHALHYCRLRHVSGGDYGRSERQREVLSSLMNQFSNIDMKQLMQIINEVLPEVYTNLSNADIIANAQVALGMLAGGAEIQSMQIPAEDAHYATMINGMSVLVPDLDKCREDLADFIYSEE